MQNKIYNEAKKFKSKYPLSIAFRLKAHSRVAAKYIGSDEEIKYVFPAQKNYKSFELFDTYLVILTDKRLVIVRKRVFFGYFFTMITPDMFNDLTIKNGIIWGKVIIDTIKEKVILSNISPKALAEIDDKITMTMIEEKKKYKDRENNK